MTETKPKTQTLAETFGEMDDDAKTNFVDDTLTALIDASKNPKKQKAIWKTLTKHVVKRDQGKGKPIPQLTGKGKAFVNQVVVGLLYSMKEEFRYQWAYLIYTILNQPIPPDLPQKVEAVRRFKYIHAGLLPETYFAINKIAEELNVQNFDELFQHLINLKNEKKV